MNGLLSACVSTGRGKTAGSALRNRASARRFLASCHSDMSPPGALTLPLRPHSLLEGVGELVNPSVGPRENPLDAAAGVPASQRCRNGTINKGVSSTRREQQTGGYHGRPDNSPAPQPDRQRPC